MTNYVSRWARIINTGNSLKLTVRFVPSEKDTPCLLCSHFEKTCVFNRTIRREDGGFFFLKDIEGISKESFMDSNPPCFKKG